LVDTDQFLLLAVSGLLQDLVLALGLEPRRLHCLPNQIKKSAWCSKLYDERQRRCALEVANKVQAIEERPPNDDLFQELVNVEEIDAGEALLMAHAASDPSSLIVTGDLRALRALSKDNSLLGVRNLLSKKVLPLEVCVKLLLDRIGHDK